MDTTPEYIKMCEMAKEIQNLRKDISDKKFVTTLYETGDWFCYTDPYSITIRMTGGNQNPTELVKGIYVVGSSSIQSSSIPDRKEKLEFINGYKEVKNIIWLPRQDQLQEIVSPSFLKEDKFMIIDKFLSFIDYADREWSFEQLWLAFVMKEKFNKIWDGEEWKETDK